MLQKVKEQINLFDWDWCASSGLTSSHASNWFNFLGDLFPSLKRTTRGERLASKPRDEFYILGLFLQTSTCASHEFYLLLQQSTEKLHSPEIDAGDDAHVWLTSCLKRNSQLKNCFYSPWQNRMDRLPIMLGASFSVRRLLLWRRYFE